jgi:uncharacterized protein involved in exopolysaccharide biosynthesis
MDDQKSRKLFLAFLNFILGLFLGSGLVMYCSKAEAADHIITTCLWQSPAYVQLSEK